MSNHEIIWIIYIHIIILLTHDHHVILQRPIHLQIMMAQARTLKVRSLAAWRITSQSVRMMRPDSEMGPLGNKSQVTNSPVDFSWHLQLVSKCFEEVCKQKSLLQFQHILASKPTLTNVDIWKNLSTWHKPFCVLCKIRPRHWTHTCWQVGSSHRPE